MNHPAPKTVGRDLVLPRWRMNQDAIVPHRSSELATWTRGNETFHVRCNKKRSLFWVYAVGPGFAGPNSKSSRVCSTRKHSLAAVWIDCVRTGFVRVEE